MLGSIISGIANLAGGLFGRKAAADANEENIEQQRAFAQQGIRWRVADAKAAGIHPLYALGAQTASFAPSSVGDPLGGAISDMGQNIGRAVDAAGTAGERATNKLLTTLQLERAGLENDLLRSQIATSRAQLGPPFPGGPGTSLSMGGQPWATDAGTSSSQSWENRYGEPAEWAVSPMIAWQDLKENIRGKSIGEILRIIDRMTALPIGGSRTPVIRITPSPRGKGYTRAGFTFGE